MSEELKKAMGLAVESASPSAVTSYDWYSTIMSVLSLIIVFAIIYLALSFKRHKQGKGQPSKGAIGIIKWLLLLASAGFNVFFTYYTFLPAGEGIANFAAIVMGGVNLAEAYLIRLAIASWRHKIKQVFKISMVFIIPVFSYSILAAGSSFATMMHKNSDSILASQLKLQAAQSEIDKAGALVGEAQAGVNRGRMLNAIYQTNVQNSQGKTLKFVDVVKSCNRNGYYARNYPDLCSRYKEVVNGTYTSADVARAKTTAISQEINSKNQMAEILETRPPELKSVFFGVAVSIGFVSLVLSLGLESAIIGTGFFEELFIRPTPLPGSVKFSDKKLDWNADGITQQGLEVTVSPSPGTVSFSASSQTLNPFSTIEARNETHLNAIETHPETHPETRDETPAFHEENQVLSLKSNSDLKRVDERIELAKAAKIGQMIDCVWCGTPTKKRTDTKRFCKPKCRLAFNNSNRGNK